MWNKVYSFVNNKRLDLYRSLRIGNVVQREAVKRVKWDAEQMSQFIEQELQKALLSVNKLYFAPRSGVTTNPSNLDKPAKLLWLLGDLSPLLSHATRVRLTVLCTDLESHSSAMVRRPATEARKALEA